MQIHTESCCIEATDIRKSFGVRDVLHVARLTLQADARVGLVGRNGAGKSTLLKILAGVEAPDAGVVNRRVPVAYIAQTDADDALAGGGAGGGNADGGNADGDAFNGAASTPDLAASTPDAGAAAFRPQAARAGLSGGERTRRRIAAAIASHRPALLCDEPTTDLDAEGVALLQRTLSAYRGALLLVSHDRSLLRALCTEIWELDAGGVTAYPCGLDAYLEERERRRAFQQFEYEQYRGEQRRLRAAMQNVREQAQGIRKAPPRMGNSEARLHKRAATQVQQKVNRARKALESRLERLEERERPTAEPVVAMVFGAAEAVVSRVAVRAEGLTLGFHGKALLTDASFVLPTGTRTVLLGANGCGKSTLVAAMRTGAAGLRFSPGVRAGFFTQETAATLDPERTALENAARDSVQPPAFTRTLLASLGLRETEALTPVGRLSGGERAKAALARLILSDVNLLVLDEPTNHLDLYAMRALETALRAFSGTQLIVTHDRAFAQALAERVLLFERGGIRTFEGGYDAFVTAEKRARRQPRADAADAPDAAEARALALSALDMRLADVVFRLSEKALKPDDKAQLEAEFQRLTAEKRALTAAALRGKR